MAWATEKIVNLRRQRLHRNNSSPCSGYNGLYRGSFVTEIRVLFLSLSIAAGVAAAQDAPPRGIVRSGSVSLLRASGKTSAGALGTIESTTDVFAAGVQATDYSQIPPVESSPVTTIGSASVGTGAPPTTTPPPKETPPPDAGAGTKA